MNRRIIPGVCLAVSSGSILFQLFVVYPTQQKMNAGIHDIQQQLKRMQEKIDFLSKK
jgi:hypothetical protein